MTHDAEARAIATSAFGASDITLGQALLNLSRIAQTELSAVAQVGGSEPAPLTWPSKTVKGRLILQIIPEIALRLITRGGAHPLLREPEALAAGQISHVDDDHLRILAAGIFHSCDFSEDIERLAQIGWQGRQGLGCSCSALEIISRAPTKGNILEIALSRACPPSERSLDAFAADFNAHFGNDVDFWSPTILHAEIEQEAWDQALRNAEAGAQNEERHVQPEDRSDMAPF